MILIDIWRIGIIIYLPLLLSKLYPKLMHSILLQLQYILRSQHRVEHLQSILIKSANPDKFRYTNLETELSLLKSMKEINSTDQSVRLLETSFPLLPDHQVQIILYNIGEHDRAFLLRTNASTHLVITETIIEINVLYDESQKEIFIAEINSILTKERPQGIHRSKLTGVRFDGVVNVSTFWHEWEASVNDTIKRLKEAINANGRLEAKSKENYGYHRKRLYHFLDHGADCNQCPQLIKDRRLNNHHPPSKGPLAFHYLREQCDYQQRRENLQRILQGLEEQSNKPDSYIMIKSAYRT